MSAPNHETHIVMLWIDNVESAHNFWFGRAGRIYTDAVANSYGSKYENAKYTLAEALKDKFTYQMYHELDSKNIVGLWADLLTSAFQDVNWNYIAETYLSDIEHSLEANNV